MESGKLYPKADLGKRLLALLIDIGVSLIIGIVPVIGWLASFAYAAFRDGFDFEFMKHRSLGKIAMKLKVVVVEGDKKVPDLMISLKRNWIFVIPIIGFIAMIVEGINVIGHPEGKRIGDSFAKTIVVEENVNIDAINATAVTQENKVIS